MFAGYDDGQCVGWDTLLRRQAVQLPGHDSRVTSLAVAPDGTSVVTGSWDTVLRVRRLPKPHPGRPTHTHTHAHTHTYSYIHKHRQL
jgi:WD40 repeat protein